MPTPRPFLLPALLTLTLSGCTHLIGTDTVPNCQLARACGDAHAEDGPKTLLEWNLHKKEKEEKEREEAKHKKEHAHHAEDGAAKHEPAAGHGEGEAAKPGQTAEHGGEAGHGEATAAEHGGEAEGGEGKESDDEDPRTTLRRIPEAPETVGVGHFVLSGGYSYFGPRSSVFQQQQNAPEALLRMGLFANWFEFRIGESWTNQRLRITDPDAAPDGQPTTVKQRGFNDLYLGTKFALTEQDKCLPESALILSITVPTGVTAFTAHQVMPDVDYDFSWEIIKHCLTLEGFIEYGGTIDGLGRRFTSATTSLSVVTDLTHKLQNYVQWYGVYPVDALDPGLDGPQHYLVSGLVYYVTDHLAVDVRAGVGLTDHSSDYLAGAGLSIRY